VWVKLEKTFDDKVFFEVGTNTLRTIGLLNKDIKKVKYFVDNNSISWKSFNEISIKSLTH